ncbi:MAG: DUF853 domain-containing protein [Lachnospiraceae bacterium]|nr:DUF853 domain-containing protein [Lachnospiraceae bacterium]
MYFDNKIWIGNSGDEKVYIYPSMANRHGLIAGATGTGKTITLKVLAESFSDAGVPVFFADVKGDLAGMCAPGVDSADMQERIRRFGLDQAGFRFTSYPTTFWDLYAKGGMPLRTTISEMGPLLLARILDLNDTQTDLLAVVFKIADDNNLLLIDTKDLKAMLNYVADNAKEYASEYGNIARASVNAIIRAIVALETEGADQFFGEPALSISDWFTMNGTDKGSIQVLDCRELIHKPNMYATFLLWLMCELMESLPEVGDGAKPRMVFFFDEAHLLFSGTSKTLLAKIEQVVKLIRSKGVGIYFVTQSPKDVPDGVLAQLGNKIQHALHAYTPAEQKAVRAAADSFRENPEFKTYDAITELAVGEALVSVLDESGVPTIVQRVKILPPQSKMGTIDDSLRDSQIRSNLLYSRYNDYYDRESAYEFLTRQGLEAESATAQAVSEPAAAQAANAPAAPAPQAPAASSASASGLTGLSAQAAAKKKKPDRDSMEYKVNAAAKSVAKTTAGTVGREVGKSLGAVGGKFGKTLGGNVGASLGRNIMGLFFKN